MSNGHTIIPLDGGENANSTLDYLRDQMIYPLDNLPVGRFPTLSELREVIQKSGYKLEESQDWYVTSGEDHTEIWFSGEIREEHSPTNFWFRRGGIIVLDIIQKLANQCGSFLVMDHSGAVAVLIVPDSVFGDIDFYSQDQNGFIQVISQRIPIIVEQLAKASLGEILFLLSQIRQALSSIIHEVHRYELFQIARQVLPVCAGYLKHNDARVRFLAFDLITILQYGFYEYADALTETVASEPGTDIKIRMIRAIQKYVSDRYGNEVNSELNRLLDTLLVVTENRFQPQQVRLTTAHLLARTKLGFLLPVIRELFIDALIQPEQYTVERESSYGTVTEVIKSIKSLMLHHRIAILLTALPKITYAQDAHEVMRELLDHVFYGESRFLQSSSLQDTHDAERPEVGEIKFRENLPKDRLYLINSVKLIISELLPFQQQILETVIELDIPWMVHSNLLEKYGFPATRSAFRAMLRNNE